MAEIQGERILLGSSASILGGYKVGAKLQFVKKQAKYLGSEVKQAVSVYAWSDVHQMLRKIISVCDVTGFIFPLYIYIHNSNSMALVLDVIGNFLFSHQFYKTYLFQNKIKYFYFYLNLMLNTGINSLSRLWLLYIKWVSLLYLLK